MKSLMKVLVSLVSISAAVCLIWNANRNKKVDESPKEKTQARQSSSSKEKNGPIEIPGIPATPDVTITNIITGKPNVSTDSLMSSSKRIEAILNKDQLEEIIEGKEKSKESDTLPPLQKE